MIATLVATLMLSQFYSPISWYTEVKAGSYYPGIDDEFGGSATPYADIFGDSGRPAYRISFEYRLLTGFGSLYGGVGLGFFHASGNALADDGSKSEDETGLWVMPAALRVSYRMDMFYTWWGLPLVPYVRAGLLYAPWWITDSDGSVADWGDGSGSARGATSGWEAALGLSLLLDVFEPESARTMDHEWGINHAYVFAEYNHMVLDGFGSDGTLILSDDHWFFGLAMEY